MNHLPMRPEDPGLPARRDPAMLPPELWLPAAGTSPLRDYWRTLKKRRHLIASVFSAIALVVALTVLPATDVYTADATLMIEPEAPQILLEIPQGQVLARSTRPTPITRLSTRS